MLSKTRQTKLLLAAICFTVVALYAQRYLPMRTLTLDAGMPGASAVLLNADDESRKLKVGWSDQRRMHYFCRFAQQEAAPSCAMAFLLVKLGASKGLDLRQFESLDLDIAYHGSAKFVRFTIRSFDPRFSTTKDGNSAKPNSINIRVADLNRPIRLQLSELTVPEWWVSQLAMGREYNGPDISNAVALVVELTEELRGTSHDIEIRGMKFNGPLIKAENWYLCIICAWMLFGTGYGLNHLIQLNRQQREQRRQISDLVRNNSRLQSEAERLQDLSTTDFLTNVSNRAGIEQIIDAMKLEMEPASLVLIDLDHFKNINDERGHDAGDRVLQAIASILGGNTRSTDRIGRWGGEEFILVVPGADVLTAAELAEKLRRLIEATAFEPLRSLRVTASFGVSALRTNEEFVHAFKRADEALYLAKEQGRNRVVISRRDGLKFDRAGAKLCGKALPGSSSFKGAS